MPLLIALYAVVVAIFLRTVIGTWQALEMRQLRQTIARHSAQIASWDQQRLDAWLATPIDDTRGHHSVTNPERH